MIVPFFNSNEVNNKSALDAHALPFVLAITDSLIATNADISNSFKAFKKSTIL